MLDFSQPANVSAAPAFNVPDDPSYGQSCKSQMAAAEQTMEAARYAELERRHAEHLGEWEELIEAARTAGLEYPGN